MHFLAGNVDALFINDFVSFVIDTKKAQDNQPSKRQKGRPIKTSTSFLNKVGFTDFKSRKILQWLKHSIQCKRIKQWQRLFIRDVRSGYPDIWDTTTIILTLSINNFFWKLCLFFLLHQIMLWSVWENLSYSM